MKITCKLTKDSPEHTFFIDIASVFYPVSFNVSNEGALKAELTHIITSLCKKASTHTSQVFSLFNIAKQNDPSVQTTHYVAWYANDFTSNSRDEISTEKKQKPYSIVFEPESKEYKARHPLFDHLANGEGARFLKIAREQARRLVSTTKETHERPQATDLIYDPKRYEFDIEKEKSRLQFTETHFTRLSKTIRDQHIRVNVLQSKISKLEEEIGNLRDNDNLSTEYANVFSRYVEPKICELTIGLSRAKSTLEKEKKRLNRYSETSFSSFIHDAYQNFATHKNIIEYINALMAFHLYEGAKSYWALCLAEAENKYNPKVYTNYLKSADVIAQDKKKFLDKKQQSFNQKFRAIGIAVNDHILQDNSTIRRYFYNCPLDQSATMIQGVLGDCAKGKRALTCVTEALKKFDEDCRHDPIFKTNPEYNHFVRTSFIAKSKKPFQWQKNLYDLVKLIDEQTKINYDTAPAEVRAATSVADAIYQEFVKKLASPESHKNFIACENELKECRAGLDQVQPGKTLSLPDNTEYHEAQADTKTQIARFKEALKVKGQAQFARSPSVLNYDSSVSRPSTPQEVMAIEIAEPIKEEIKPKLSDHQRACATILNIISNAGFWNKKLHGGGTSKTTHGKSLTLNDKPIKVQHTIAEFIRIFDEGSTKLHNDKDVFQDLHQQLKLVALKSINTKKWYHGTLFDPRDKISLSFYQAIANSNIDTLVSNLEKWMDSAKFPRPTVAKR